MEHTVSDDSLSEDNSSTSVTLIAGPAGATGQDADGDSPAHADATDATVVAAADLAIMEVKHRQKTSIVSKMNLVLETKLEACSSLNAEEVSYWYVKSYAARSLHLLVRDCKARVSWNPKVSHVFC